MISFREVPNISVDFRIPSDGTAAEQTQIFDDLLVKGTNGIALSPVDPANQTAMIDRGTDKALIVTQDSDAPKSKRSFTSGLITSRLAARLVSWSKRQFRTEVKLCFSSGNGTLRTRKNASKV
jgi:ABC-type sugar transport system substrate-binding protein